MEPTSISGAHAQPSTLAANRSELSQLSGPDIVPCQHSQDGVPDSEPASDLALQSGQSCTSNQEYSGSSPMTWSKDGDAEAAPVETAWSDLFDNQEKLKTYSRSRQLLLEPSACCYFQKEWSLVFTSSQRHFQYFGISSTPNPPVRQAGVLDSSDYTLRPTLLDANAPYRALITHTESDPPSYTPVMNVQNNGVKMILPYYQSLYTKFFSSCRCALEHWSSVVRYFKLQDIPLPPMKPASLGCSTSLEFIPDSIWANGDVHLNVLTRGLMSRGLDDLVRMGTPVFGVMEYPHCNHRDIVPDHCPNSPEAATAAAGEYFAAMKKWEDQNINVAEHIIHIEVPLAHVQHLNNWFIRPHLGYPGESDRNDCPLCEAAWRVLTPGEICKTDVVALRDFLGHGPWPAGQAYKVPKFYYKYKFGESIKIYVNEDEGPTASSSKAVVDNMDDHGFNIYDDIMGTPMMRTTSIGRTRVNMISILLLTWMQNRRLKQRPSYSLPKVEMVLQSLELLRFFKVLVGRRGEMTQWDAPPN
ncbi:hypothetical protein BS47DRAFT_1361566 [Hydnum rufescens UP504]|uniref:Uncharacterized protein n=1 Tax=Hydnum rufescens UP504 TaxID=1448309 RepID=A0A9P6B1M8_9AGAM|nr:hypothetical protein BS47DRAFT_1361566 [Hydnum rufescens UP504]